MVKLKNLIYARPGTEPHRKLSVRAAELSKKHPGASVKQIRAWSARDGWKLGITATEEAIEDPDEMKLWGISYSIEQRSIPTQRRNKKTGQWKEKFTGKGLVWSTFSSAVVRAKTEEEALAMIDKELGGRQTKLLRATEGYISTDIHPTRIPNAQEIDESDRGQWEGVDTAEFSTPKGTWNILTRSKIR